MGYEGHGVYGVKGEGEIERERGDSETRGSTCALPAGPGVAHGLGRA